MVERHVMLRDGVSVSVRVVPSARMRRMRLRAVAVGVVEVKVPTVYAWSAVMQFIERETLWLRKVFRLLERRTHRATNTIVLKGSRADCVAHRAQAITLIRTHLADLAVLAPQRVAAIRIGNQKTRWGSCSRRGVLSFNYRIVYLPVALQRYLVAHEVAHLTHMNHSAIFWKEVERLLPEYQQARALLRHYRIDAS